jgi:hypothetical protein
MKSGILLISAMGVAAVVLAAQVGLAEDRLGMPAMGESSSPDDHLATSSDSDSDLGHSQNPDDLLVESVNPDSLLAESEDPDSLVVESENLDDRLGHSTALQDLPDADAQEREIEQETLAEMRERHRTEGLAEDATATPRDGPPSTSGNRMNAQIASIRAAKKQFAAAKARASKADEAYGVMMERDYPRGEARLKIVDERKLAQQELESAQKTYDAALNGDGNPASN